MAPVTGENCEPEAYNRNLICTSDAAGSNTCSPDIAVGYQRASTASVTIIPRLKLWVTSHSSNERLQRGNGCRQALLSACLPACQQKRTQPAVILRDGSLSMVTDTSLTSSTLFVVKWVQYPFELPQLLTHG